MTNVVESLLRVTDGILLVEYSSTDHPERTFFKILDGWRGQGITPLIVDIGDTLHIFLQNLKFAGISPNIDDVPVIKERGMVKVGKVVGSVEVVEDFEYHLATYSQLARKVPSEVRNHTIVLGMEKFSFTFIDNPRKLEMYFETVTRRYLPVEGKTTFLFLNTDIASDYLAKGLEQDSDYVLRVRGSDVRVLKSPGVGNHEL
ncbi:DUF257 family protein [Thermococcus sp. 21S9]|uniref:DUF257 family protein n=1 Tax=Thermococcus sp. 21S9 TaxID=1638223 RepID=UPI0016929598|nr:DUF257 family protein [Thermococcus sp. 21S9]NJE54480.1 hypothetical protein [Thermococcus sp. 21S9]